MGHDFKFEVIPLAEAVAYPVLTEDDNDEAPVVLVVDDEPLIVDSLAAILAGSGLNVLKAYNGTAALEIAMQTPPHLLLTDVAMPGMNGIQLAMAVADCMPACRVLLFSAHAATLDLYPARAAGFDFRLLVKPLHPREMLRQVFAILEDKPSSRTAKPHKIYNEAAHAAAPWMIAEANG